jgi:hypothetical protein
VKLEMAEAPRPGLTTLTLRPSTTPWAPRPGRAMNAWLDFGSMRRSSAARTTARATRPRFLGLPDEADVLIQIGFVAGLLHFKDDGALAIDRSANCFLPLDFLDGARLSR